MAKTITELNECRITEAHVKEYDRSTNTLSTSAATNMGCIGKIELTGTYQTIVKNCEGVEKKSSKILTKLTGKLNLHMPIAIARKVYGLSNDGLATGVYALDVESSSKVPNMLFTAKVIDLFSEENKLICIPYMTITSGFVKTIDNTSTEVAEVELEFSCYKDDNGKFYYEALESEADTTVTSKWLENFTPSLALKTT